MNLIFEGGRQAPEQMPGNRGHHQARSMSAHFSKSLHPTSPNMKSCPFAQPPPANIPGIWALCANREPMSQFRHSKLVNNWISHPKLCNLTRTLLEFKPFMSFSHLLSSSKHAFGLTVRVKIFCYKYLLNFSFIIGFAKRNEVVKCNHTSLIRGTSLTQVLLCLYSSCSRLIPYGAAEAFHFSSLKQLLIAQHSLLFAFFLLSYHSHLYLHILAYISPLCCPVFSVLHSGATCLNLASFASMQTLANFNLLQCQEIELLD